MGRNDSYFTDKKESTKSDIQSEVLKNTDELKRSSFFKLIKNKYNKG